MDAEYIPNLDAARLSVSPRYLATDRLRMDRLNREITLDDRVVALRPTPFRLLETLMFDAGNLVAKEELIRAVWPDTTVTDESLTTAVRDVRRALDDTSRDPSFIRTVPRAGYLFIPSVRFETDQGLSHEDGPEKATASPAISATSLASAHQKRGSISRRTLIGAGLGGAALASFGVLRFAGSDRPWRLGERRLLAVGPTIDVQPALSPDASQIIFSSHRQQSANRNLYLMSSNGGDPVEIHSHPGFDHLPAFSPTGREVAYFRSELDAEAQPCQLLMRGVPSGNDRIIGGCRINGYSLSRPAFSADGRYLFYSDSTSDNRDAALAIVRLDLSSGEVKQVSKPDRSIRGDMDPVPSPDGRYMLFSRAHTLREKEAILHSMIDGSEIALSSRGDTVSHIWSPDGEHALLVGSDEGGGIATYRRDGTLVGREASGLVQPIVRLSGARDQAVGEYVRRSSSIKVGDELASTDISVTNAIHELPAFSSDGHLAFVTREDSRSQIWASERGEPAFRVAEVDKLSDLAWSADNERLAWLLANGEEIGVVHARSGSERRYPLKAREVASLAWVPEANSLIFARRDDETWRLQSLNLETGEVRPFSDRHFWAVRGNARALYATRSDRPGIWELDPQGNIRRQVDDQYRNGREIGRSSAMRMGFAVTADMLFTRAFLESSRPSGDIFVTPLAGGETQKKTERPYLDPRFAVSNDGRIATITDLSNPDIIGLRLIRA